MSGLVHRYIYDLALTCLTTFSLLAIPTGGLANCEDVPHLQSVNKILISCYTATHLWLMAALCLAPSLGQLFCPG